MCENEDPAQDKMTVYSENDCVFQSNAEGNHLSWCTTVAIYNKLDNIDIHSWLWQLTPEMSWNPLPNLVFPVKKGHPFKTCL